MVAVEVLEGTEAVLEVVAEVVAEVIEMVAGATVGVGGVGLGPSVKVVATGPAKLGEQQLEVK